jgi:YD repeat-containing protein
LERGELDVIISREAVATSGVKTVEVIGDILVLAVPADHPLAHSQNIGLSELADLNFIFFSRSASPDYHDRIMSSCRSNGLVPIVVQEVDGWSAILSLVSAGFGVSLVSSALSRTGFRGVAFPSLNADLADAAFRMSWRTDGMNPAAERLRTAIATGLVYDSRGHRVAENSAMGGKRR